jgi:DNA polymerase-1
VVARTIELPNVRKLFIPDEGYLLVEVDLQRAESQVVAWESGDADLKQIFQSGIDIHSQNAEYTYGQPANYYRRDRLKRCVYAIQNGGREAKVSELLGNPILGQRFYSYWTGRFPAIQAWHRELDLHLRSGLENIWGYKIHYTLRPGDPLPLGEAIPWITQSTIGITINHALVAIDEQVPEAQLFYQVHDALLLQIPTRHAADLLPCIYELSRVPIPYPDPLIIPPTLQVSEKSWGEMSKWEPHANAKTG